MCDLYGKVHHSVYSAVVLDEVTAFVVEVEIDCCVPSGCGCMSVDFVVPVFGVISLGV